MKVVCWRNFFISLVIIAVMAMDEAHDDGLGGAKSKRTETKKTVEKKNRKSASNMSHLPNWLALRLRVQCAIKVCIHSSKLILRCRLTSTANSTGWYWSDLGRGMGRTASNWQTSAQPCGVCWAFYGFFDPIACLLSYGFITNLCGCLFSWAHKNCVYMHTHIYIDLSIYIFT